jgi:hypothetical protein
MDHSAIARQEGPGRTRSELDGNDGGLADEGGLADSKRPGSKAAIEGSWP